MFAKVFNSICTEIDATLKMFKKWCEVTSCEGIIDLYQARTNKAKFTFWLIVMLSMLGTSVYFMYRTIQGFIDKPLVTNVAIIREKQLDIPEVLICFNGGMNVKALKQSGFDEYFIHTLFNQLYSNDQTSNVNDTKAQLLDYMNMLDINMKEFLIEHSYKCDDLIISDEHLGEVCSRSAGVITQTGICYIYTSIRQQYFAGTIGGMNLKLQVPNETYPSIYPNKAVQLKMTNSFTLFLEKTFGKTMSQRSFMVPAETVVSVALNTKRYILTRNCDNQSNVTSSNSCLDDCLFFQFERKYNCRARYFTRLTSNSTIDICNVFDMHLIQRDDPQVLECEKKCLPLCDEWIFESTLSYGQIEPNAIANKTTIINIAYSSKQYTQIETVDAFTIDMAIGNVGGQAGLWLGVSIVTVIQALYYCILAVVKQFDRKQLQIMATLSK